MAFAKAHCPSDSGRDRLAALTANSGCALLIQIGYFAQRPQTMKG